MKNSIFKIFTISALSVACITSSCNKDLDLTPTNDITSIGAYSTPEGYKSVLAKVYGSFAMTGNSGAGSGDLGGIDPGNSDFFRLYWNLQELTTDEAACVWNDPGIYDLNYNTWTSSNPLLRGLYNRSLFQITVANEFIRESADDVVSGRGITGAAATEIAYYKAEARFLRAFQYWVLMDLFGNPSFVTEADPIGTYIPPQISRAELFNYVESELKAIEPLLKAPRQNEYGRADQAAVWALLARLYLNAEVYLGAGNGKYTEAITYSKKVIDAGFALAPKYQNVFSADNNTNNSEIILSINYDGVKTQNWGGTTFLVNAAVNGAMNPSSFGVPNGGWGGNRSRDPLSALFNANDSRKLFAGNDPEMDDIATFTEGLAVVKFTNKTSTGANGQSANGTFVSTDFPLFRLAEMHLVYAEAVKRGGSGGDEATALRYFNALRTRAFGSTAGNVTSFTLDDVLNERARELYWEGFRRTDLVRYGKFAGSSYLWPFKGGVKVGRSFEDYRNIFPIPAADVSANPKLTQNDGY